jgi:hypothetical protein
VNLPRRIAADAVGGLLLVGAAAVLLSTPYDGGSCSYVLAAYAVPAASLPESEPPKESPALDDAQDAVSAANAEVAELEGEQAEVDAAYAAAQDARSAANDAEDAAWESSYSDYSSDSYLAELDVDFAESAVESAEDWLAYVQGDLGSEWAIYTQADVDAAQADLDEALADLAEAQSTLAQAQSEDAAQESAAADAEATAEELDAAADAAEQAAADLAADLYDRQRAAEDQLYSVRSLVAQLQTDHEIELAEWSHDQRMAADEVTALNNVRASCRENGAWRAGVALLDVLLVIGLILRRYGPRIAWHRLRLPWRRR